ncbi:hypothetical protein CPSG_06178 [Coccidioides posadasii str. Silveira]|uniref:Uncharacterized protein n=2 Tax=Coccidioides posadasii TaxID=199306 RepID=E9D8M6_COCPS|nr:hypothetical protein CPSG_06178 [Coccidioides posadasii str. Silveira]KMM63811.1 hypothetical protein CPAG_00165 [Coccidioides posadasii RMSCC 3488]
MFWLKAIAFATAALLASVSAAPAPDIAERADRCESGVCYVDKPTWCQEGWEPVHFQVTGCWVCCTKR